MYNTTEKKVFTLSFIGADFYKCQLGKASEIAFLVFYILPQSVSNSISYRKKELF